jgi:hypothetical protein
MNIKTQMLRHSGVMFAVVLVCASLVAAQGKIFNYQGTLTDGAVAANGTYQMQFSLYDAETGGKPLQVVSDDAVTIKDGVFKVSLNFTAAKAFDGAEARYLEVAVRKPSETNYTTLPSRHLITRLPYSLKTLCASFSEAGATPFINSVPDGTIGNRVVLTGRPAAAITYTAGQAIAGRTITINKAFDDTQLRITYVETFESPNGRANGQVFITVNGSPTYGNPGIISAIAVPIGGTFFSHGQANIVGYATLLPAGQHTIGVMIASNPLTTFPHFQYVLEVEEVRTRPGL